VLQSPWQYAIQGFTTEHLPDKVSKKFTTLSEYESYMPVVTLRYKEFGDRLSRVKGKLGGMRYNFCHNMCLNVDGVSIEKAGRELLKRPEKRKVLMVLSDGEPNDGYSCIQGGLERHLKNVINSLAAQGVEVFGIGIESDAVSSYYPDYAVLNDVADLEKEVIGRMEGLLLDGRHVRKAS
jgi:cobaltochelatase CobT